MSERANDAWRVGDLAVCVNHVGWKLGPADEFSWSHGPRPEAILRVIDVSPIVEFTGSDGSKLNTIGLCFAEWPDRHFAAVHFRRVKPVTEAAADAGFIALIKRPRVGVGA